MALPGQIVDPKFNVGGPLESVVERNWGKVFGDETGKLPPSITIDKSWFELRGDLIAAQLSMKYYASKVHVSPEDIIDSLSMRLPAPVLRSRV